MLAIEYTVREVLAKKSSSAELATRSPPFSVVVQPSGEWKDENGRTREERVAPAVSELVVHGLREQREGEAEQ